MSRVEAVPALVAAVTVLLGAGHAAAQPASWAITRTTLVDGTGGAPVENAVIVGRGDRIECAGRTAECRVPAGATVIDGTRRYVVPGLIDTHVHLSWPESGASERAQQTRLAFGITTTRDAGGAPGYFERSLAQRQAAAAPSVAQPRLIVSGLLSDEHMNRYGERDPGALVRRLAALGADAIKIKEPFTPDELQAIVTAAHAAGLPVFGHTWGRSGSRLTSALDAGIDGVSHLATFSEFGQRVDAQRPPAPPPGLAYWVWTRDQWNYQDGARLSLAIRRVVEQHVWIEPMLVTERHFTLPYPVPADAAYLGDVLSIEQILRTALPVGDTGWVKRAQRRARIASAFTQMCDVVRRVHGHGGVVLTGTDDMLPGPGLLDEIQLLTECGLSPMAALQAATQRAAIALKRPDLGTIEAGKLADLVILAADPLADPAHLRRPWRVIKGGRVHDPAALLAPMREAYRQRLTRAWVARTATGLVVGALLMLAVTGFRRWRPRSG